MGLFDGTIRKFADKFCAALEEQATIRLNGDTEGKGKMPVVALALMDIVQVLRKVVDSE